LPQDYVSLQSDEDKQMFERLMGMIDEIDDVQNVYHNVQSDE
ncbi:MAG: YebC/PmpR family DNA-binding transcriptional regulator, partial [Firmicutes bacterium HGW-Firmicutes-19]